MDTDVHSCRCTRLVTKNDGRTRTEEENETSVNKEGRGRLTIVMEGLEKVKEQEKEKKREGIVSLLLSGPSIDALAEHL